MAEVGVVLQRVEAEADAMQGGDDRRDDGGDTERLAGALVGVDVDERSQAELVGGDRQRRPYSSQRRAGRRGQGPEHGDDGCRQDSVAGNLGAEGRQLGVVREVADGDEMPHLLERAGAGELGGVDAAVVEEAGLAVDVTDRGVGDGDAVEAGGDVDQVAHAPHREAPDVAHQC